MPDLSARLGLPYLMPAQAQKHVTHNEALALLDLLVQLTVQEFDALTPPPAPDEGQIWALGPAPSGEWVSHGGRLAAWVGGAWLFIAPQEGWCATQIMAQGTTLRLFTAAGWVAPAADTLDNLTGLGVNTAHDATNRLAVASAATLLSHDGDGHQLKINKAAAGDTASLLFQTDWSGRAEMGTAGNDDWSVKVSPDGADWHTALVADGGTGQVTLPNGLSVSGALDLPAASVTRAALAAGNALSVIGRSASSSGAVDDIAAGSDHQVMRRAGSGIGFGAVALNQPAAVSGLLPVANGGTGAATAATARSSLGLGTGATATVTTSATDTTAGRLLKIGDWGVGGTNGVTPPDNNADSAVRPGFYNLTSGIANNPSGGTATLRVERSFSAIVQIVESTNSARGNWRRRSVDNGATWEAWQRGGAQTLGTVSQAAGVPTGALMQSGFVADRGWFERYANGLQICWWNELEFTETSSGAFMEAPSWLYGAGFVSAPEISVRLPSATQGSNAGPNWLNGEQRKVSVWGGGAGSTQLVTPRIHAIISQAFNSGMTITCGAMAIGRWF